MQIEYEATFTDIDKDEMRTRLKKAGAELLRPEFLQKRINYRFPSGHQQKPGWVRLRDEGDKITLTIKMIEGEKIEDQKEISLTIDDFDEAVEFVETLGCEKKAYQETKRELWKLDEVEIMLDEWPFLEPFVEVEGKSEEAVKNVAEKLGFDYRQAFFGCVTPLYAKKYGWEERAINVIPEIIFEGKNPFEK